jgi:Protein of unknown function (DUF2934)
MTSLFATVGGGTFGLSPAALGRQYGAGSASSTTHGGDTMGITEEAVANRAYQKFGQRSPEGGSAETDWLNAEQELLAEAHASEAAARVSSFPTPPTPASPPLGNGHSRVKR